MIEKECKIVQDLLPNYIEKLTSQTSNDFIEKHLENCNECKSVAENMEKELKFNSEKREEREVEYFKKYNKKMKLSKKILLLVLSIALIYVLTVIYKYSILTIIQKRNEESNNSNNRYYHSVTQDTIIEVYKKDGIMKVNLQAVQGDGDITLWKNENTGEEYVFWNDSKIYSKNNGGIMGISPSSMMTAPDFLSRLMVAIHPMMFVGTQKYNGTYCYNLKFDDVYEIIEKETGHILYTNNGGSRSIKYSFDTVTDEDVKLPDISEYELKD